MEKSNATPMSALRPEIIDAISHVQSAHRCLEPLPEILAAQDPALLDDFGYGETIREYQTTLSELRCDLLRLLSDVAAVSRW